MTACEAKAVPIQALHQSQLRNEEMQKSRDVPSLISQRSTSSFEIPAFERTLGIAKAGPIPITLGSTPATAQQQNLARMGSPSSFAFERRVRRTAAAPSETCETMDHVQSMLRSYEQTGRRLTWEALPA